MKEFKPEFVSIVNFAVEKSKEFYNGNSEDKKPNPYFIGFGYPESDTIIFGKELGFNKVETSQLFFESINNPSEWHEIIKNDKRFSNEIAYPNSGAYRNAFYPYDREMPAGHTWSKYATLVRSMISELPIFNNSFLTNVFISEVSHEPAKRSNGATRDKSERNNFIKQSFYQSFPKVILACGNYLSESSIEEIFNVKQVSDKSFPREKLVVYHGFHKILINTRQLSNSCSNKYLERIAEELKSSHF